jgi:Cu/Ag efflux pump CusA
MTSLAFILGVLPLVYATGAGAEMRQSLGTAVFSGMIGVTLFGLIFTPVFYVLIRGIAATRFWKGRDSGPRAGESPPTAGGPATSA